MNWSGWRDFAAMGGYGLYVWGSFGVVAVALVAECVAVHMRRRALRQQFSQRPIDPVRSPGFKELPREA